MPRIVLSLVVPCGPGDDAALQNLLASIDRQAFPREHLEVLIERDGNSEEAKAYGIQRSRGEIIGLLCTDNQLLGHTFLADMVKAARQSGVVGAYPRHYAWMREDTALNRYFALLGANDPLCWWLGKADRAAYLTPQPEGDTYHTFTDWIPSLGDNGFFVKASAIKPFVLNPATHFCIDVCEDMRRAGLATYITTANVIWHRSGASWRTWLRKRWRYVNALYWARLSDRRWRMVQGWRDYSLAIGFLLASLMVLPHLFLSLQGYRRVRDRAWFLHPLVCGALSCLYAWAWSRHYLSNFLHGLKWHDEHYTKCWRCQDLGWARPR